MTRAPAPAERYWKFACPECGLGDGEWGHLAADEELHCAFCLSEDGRHVRLLRWLEPRVERPTERLDRHSL